MAQVSAANLGGEQVFLIDYAAAQPCTLQCPGGTPGCDEPAPRYSPQDSQPISISGYDLNMPSIWGGKNMNGKQQGNYQVYDGVIVRTPWIRVAAQSTPGNPGGRYLRGSPKTDKNCSDH